MDDLRAPPERLWVIPPGVDSGLFTPDRAGNEQALRERLGLEPGRPILVSAGRIQPLKDQELGIRILAELSAMSPPPLLVIAGEGRRRHVPTAPRVGRRRPRRRERRAFRRRPGPGEPRDLFAAAECTLVTSYSETFGLVALESAASGTPVFAHDGTGLSESVSEGRSGYLLESREPADWAAAIRAHHADGARVTSMRRSARAFAEGFTWATAAASHLALYESLVR
ncbi:MAG: glycosyltransferase [Galbitalea sp.]